MHSAGVNLNVFATGSAADLDMKCAKVSSACGKNCHHTAFNSGVTVAEILESKVY